ncbi:MAG: tonB-system energizer ExbB [Gammaproteobacteria bacterium]|nr:MAG: tonB-system energizer ExbB [Gammaproteobacteria bacterium]
MMLTLGLLFTADIYADDELSPSTEDVVTTTDAAGTTSAFSEHITEGNDGTSLEGEDAPALTEEAELDESLVDDEVASTLPHNLSPWGMFMAADWIVKTVMIGLAIASLLTWTILLSKSIELSNLQRRLRGNLTPLLAAKTLTDAANNHDINGIAQGLVDAADDELRLSADLANKAVSKEGIKERVASSLSRIEVATIRKMMIGTGVLATIGSVAPFVGLFGTVWGIMNSFIGISESQTTNLAVVAPGIAEALLATAMGLVAAIPAVVIYNHFTRKISATKALVADINAAIMRLISRDLDREVHLTLVKTNTSQVKAAD